MIHIDGCFYEVIQNVREGWNIEAFKERYSEVLNKYDYIVGDWGYSQLRLRGFYDDYNKKAKPAFDAKISTLDEYIHEYCNFGCSYFVVKKVNAPKGFVGDLAETVQDEEQESNENNKENQNANEVEGQENDSSNEEIQEIKSKEE
jgi:uncharacterized protein YutD